MEIDLKKAKVEWCRRSSGAPFSRSSCSAWSHAHHVLIFFSMYKIQNPEAEIKLEVGLFLVFFMFCVSFLLIFLSFSLVYIRLYVNFSFLLRLSLLFFSPKKSVFAVSFTNKRLRYLKVRCLDFFFSFICVTWFQ